MLDVINLIYLDGSVTETQKWGTILCQSKRTDPGGPEDYRPLTLLNADYKLLTRIIATILRPWMSDLLQTGQYCGQVNTIFDAVAAVREIVAYTEIHNVSVYLLTLHFRRPLTGSLMSISTQYYVNMASVRSSAHV